MSGTTVGTGEGNEPLLWSLPGVLPAERKKAPVQLRKFTVEFVYTETLFLLYGDISNL